MKKHHIGSVMPSYSDVDWTEDGLGNRINMHGNRDLISGWLKDQQDFNGFVISDYNGIDHINPGTDTFAAAGRAGVNAGIDMFMQPTNFEQFESTLTSLVNDGTVPMARIDDAVSRILTKKFQLGLFEHPYTDRTHLSEIGDAAHHAVARRAVAESQVLLKNERATLPIRGSRPVYVAGSNADNIGNQAGGWTLTWQGGSTNVIPGQTILQGIQVRARQRHVQPGRVGTGAAERRRHRRGRRDAVLRGLRRRRRPAVGLRPGRPRRAAPAQDHAALRRGHGGGEHGLCAGREVRGRRGVRPADDHPAGDARPTSTPWSRPGCPAATARVWPTTCSATTPTPASCPVTWPRTVSQEPINIGDRQYDPLFPFGFGLRTR